MVARGIYVRFVARSPEQQEHKHVEYPFVPHCWMAEIRFSISIFLKALWNIILIQHSSDRPMGILAIPFGPPRSTKINMFIYVVVFEQQNQKLNTSVCAGGPFDAGDLQGNSHNNMLSVLSDRSSLDQREKSSNSSM